MSQHTNLKNSYTPKMSKLKAFTHRLQRCSHTHTHVRTQKIIQNEEQYIQTYKTICLYETMRLRMSKY